MRVSYRVFLCLVVWLVWSAGIIHPPLPGSSVIAAHISQAAAASRGQVVRVARKKSPRPQASFSLVRDIRVTPHPEYTRVVLDLQQSVTFTQVRQANPNRLRIELRNAILGKVAQSKVASGGLPDSVEIRQSTANPKGRTVTLSLDLQSISDYKLLPLSKPARLVIDLYHRMDEEAAPVREAAGGPVLSPPPSKPQAQTSAPRPAKKDINTIVIDAGHGGKDPGAIGRSGMAEKDITLQVALLLRDLIVKHLRKRVLLTRDRDVFVELEDRARFANSQGADLFISIHVNSHPQRSTKGLEIYHFGEASDPRALAVAARENGTPLEETGVGWQYLVADLLTTKKIEESLELAWTTKQAMVAHLESHYDVVDHGVKTAPFYVLRFTTMPSILAEIAFISNPTEERLMQSEAFLLRMAEALFEGIQAFINPLRTAAS